MRLLFSIVLLIASAIVLAAQGAALDYPQWRGQQRDGSASAFAEPNVWPDQLTRRWRVEVGEGYATPILVGNTVYTFTRVDGSEVMTALDADTATVRWRSGYAAAFTPSQPTAAHGAGPKATPLFHQGKLFTLGIGGILSAFDAGTGKRLWQTSAPAEAPYFSAASSPAGYDGLILAHPGNYEPLTAFDGATGAVKWRVGDGGFFASPIVVTLDGVTQAVTMTQSAVVGVSLPDGALLWSVPIAGANGGPTPAVAGETIIVSAGESTTAIKPTRRDGRWTVETAWQTKEVSMYISTPVVVGSTLFGLSTRQSGQFFAIDTGTGKTLWLGQPRQAVNTALVKAGSLVFYLNDDAQLIVAAANRSRFDPLKRYTVAESATWAQPLISGNRVFVKDVSSLTLWTMNGG